MGKAAETPGERFFAQRGLKSCVRIWDPEKGTCKIHAVTTVPVKRMLPFIRDFYATQSDIFPGMTHKIVARRTLLSRIGIE